MTQSDPCMWCEGHVLQYTDVNGNKGGPPLVTVSNANNSACLFVCCIYMDMYLRRCMSAEFCIPTTVLACLCVVYTCTHVDVCLSVRLNVCMLVVTKNAPGYFRWSTAVG